MSDEQPGFSRQWKGEEFEYFDTKGKPIVDEQRLLAHQTARYSAGVE